MAGAGGMDLARRQLEKYGWKPGAGLGREGLGIKEALRPKLKFDKAGLGVDPGADFTTRWWEDAFNQTARGIAVTHDENGDVTVKKTAKQDVKRSKSTTSYGRFVKGAVLDDGKETWEDSDVAHDLEEPTKHVPLSDEELMRVCNGRTAHKAARHGNRLSGKLARVQQQEQEHGNKWKRQSEKDELGEGCAVKRRKMTEKSGKRSKGRKH